MIKVRSPNIKYYADRIVSGVPFSFIRLGDGLFAIANPEITMSGTQRLNAQMPGLVEGYTNALRNCPVHDNFIVGLWQQCWFKWNGWTEVHEKWVSENMNPDLKFHHGRVWVDAIQAGEFFPIIDAMKNTKLPIVVIGPRWMHALRRVTGLHIVRHYVVDRALAWHMHDAIRDELLEKKDNRTIYLFCVGDLKPLIVELWSTVGQNNFMLDFGGGLNIFCGHQEGTSGPTWEVTLLNLWKNLGHPPVRWGNWGMLGGWDAPPI